MQLNFDKHQKNIFMAYIYIRLGQDLDEDENSRIGAKIEAVKHLQAAFLQTAEQYRCPIRL